jgi:hypothetical protein
MNVTRIALTCAALLAMAAADAWAAGHGGGHSGGHSGGGHFHHGARARVFISSPAFFYPSPYYYYPAPAYPYAPAPPVEYIQQAPATESQYWYYCPGSAAYYPYVNECSGGWQLVQPTGETVQPSFPG